LRHASQAEEARHHGRIVGQQLWQTDRGEARLKGPAQGSEQQRDVRLGSSGVSGRGTEGHLDAEQSAGQMSCACEGNGFGSSECIETANKLRKPAFGGTF
jgi:hypothetical protein